MKRIVIILTSHLILCAALYVILRKVTGSKLCSTAGALFFMMSPGIICTVTNTDTINQSWTALMGASAALAYFNARNSGKKGLYLCWIGLAFLSALFRENGIAWFLAPVLLYMVYELGTNGVNLKKDSAFILAGVIGTLLYFCVRFLLMGKIALGNSSGRYALSFSPDLIVSIMRHYAQIMAGAMTSHRRIRSWGMSARLQLMRWRSCSR